jgi:hypothetical protein
MTSDDTRQRVFRRMLAREAGPGADAPAIAAACRRLWERFAQQFTPLIGDVGVAAIFARSLHLSRRNVPELAPRRASNKPDKSDRRDAPFVLLEAFLEQQEPAAAADAAVAVLAMAGELLASFIGEGLTTRLLREAWPDDFAADDAEETIL